MPASRPARPRLVSNENDENSNSAGIMTRAKAAAALNVDEVPMQSKAFQSKKSAINANAQIGVRKRAALGDVSNMAKTDAGEGKKVSAKGGLVSKAAQPTGVQKTHPRNTSSRTVLGSKGAKKTSVAENRSGSGSGVIRVQKRKGLNSATTATDESVADEREQPSRKKVHSTDSQKIVRTESKTESLDSKPNDAEPAVRASSKPVYPPGVKDLDSEDLDDPLMVAEYAVEIFEYLRDLECATVPNPDYMNHQDDLEWKTRGILVDWLIEVHTRFHLLPETLFLAINIIDRFLSEKVVQLDRLQLVGITAMFIASKYEEVLSPHVSNFRHVADDGFTESEILNAERFVLTTLNYDLSYPNPMNFLRRISKADNYDIQSRTIGKYLMEVSLLDHRFMGFRPSHIAAGAMYLARLILDRGEWDKTLSFYAGYDEDEIEPIIQLMVDYLARPIIHEAFFKKYASKRFLKASILSRQWAKLNAVHFDIMDVELTLDQIS